jgi:hypothetical protein
MYVSQNLADMDGLGVLKYQWYSDKGVITGATGTTFAPTQTHVGSQIYVRANYTDGFGKAESVFSASTSPVQNVNDAPTGKVTIVGEPWLLQTLSVDTSTLKDADGLPDASELAYQWYADGLAINDANAKTLMLSDDFVGASISVEVSYLDAGDTEELVVSEETAPVLAKDSPTEGTLSIVGLARQGQLLQVQQALSDDDGMGDGPVVLQWLADGQPLIGQTGDVLLLTQAMVNKKISVVATYTDGHGNVGGMTSPQTVAVANVNDAPTGGVTVVGAAKQGVLLKAAHTLADVDGMGDVRYQWKANGVNISGATDQTFTLKQTQVGQKITVAATYTDKFGTVESKSSLSTAAVVTAYSLAASSSSVNEGSTVTFTATTTALSDLPTSGKINYTLTGISASDVEGGALSGTAVIDTQGKAVFTVKLTADLQTEGSETLTANVFGATTKVTVNDVSKSPATDTIAPTVTTFSPADEATAVAVGANIVVTFNEAVQIGTGSIVLKTAAGVVVDTYKSGSSNLNISGSTLTINPSADLGYNAGYKVEFAAGSIKDIAGNSYAGKSDYNFTTAAAVPVFIINSTGINYSTSLVSLSGTLSGTPSVTPSFFHYLSNGVKETVSLMAAGTYSFEIVKDSRWNNDGSYLTVIGAINYLDGTKKDLIGRLNTYMGGVIFSEGLFDFSANDFITNSFDSYLNVGQLIFPPGLSGNIAQIEAGYDFSAVLLKNGKAQVIDPKYLTFP